MLFTSFSITWGLAYGRKLGLLIYGLHLRLDYHERQDNIYGIRGNSSRPFITPSVQQHRPRSYPSDVHHHSRPAQLWLTFLRRRTRTQQHNANNITGTTLLPALPNHFLNATLLHLLHAKCSNTLTSGVLHIHTPFSVEERLNVLITAWRWRPEVLWWWWLKLQEVMTFSIPLSCR